MVMQTLSDLLYSCALTDAVLEPSAIWLSTLVQSAGKGAGEDHSAAVRLAEWCGEKPVEMWQMTASCVARILPRLARVEAERLLCKALPRLYETGALPPPPDFRALDVIASGGPASEGTKPEQISSKQAASLGGLQAGVVAAMLWLASTGSPKAALLCEGNDGPKFANARIGSFLRAWPYSPSSGGGVNNESGGEGDGSDEVLASLAEVATRQAIGAMQSVCGTLKDSSENPASEAVDAQVFGVVCGLLGSTARVAAAYSADADMRNTQACAGMVGCAKATHLLAASLLQRPVGSPPQGAQWSQPLRQLPQPQKRELGKLLKRARKAG